MRNSVTITLCLSGALLTLALTTGGALAQGIGKAPMSREAAEAMADGMLLRMGPMLGLDSEEFSGASREQRMQMIRGAADGMSAESVRQQMEGAFGAPPGGAGAGYQPRISQPEPEPEPLRPAPRRGFPDGAVPLPVAGDYRTELVVDEPAGRKLLLVAADIGRHEIVLRETRAVPFSEQINLRDIAPDPNMLVLELIDPETHRVIRRYRPVAAAE